MDWTNLITGLSAAAMGLCLIKQSRELQHTTKLWQKERLEHIESTHIFTLATDALAEACPIEKLDGEWQWQKAVRYINALKAELAQCGSGLYPKQISVSHLQVQHFLNLVEDAFPYPEGFEGRHRLTVNSKTGELELGIWMLGQEAVECHTVRFFGKVELLDEKLVEDLKASAPKNSAT